MLKTIWSNVNVVLSMRQTQVAQSSFNNTWSTITYALYTEWHIDNTLGEINWSQIWPGNT